jgi:hypothetical protein
LRVSVSNAAQGAVWSMELASATLITDAITQQRNGARNVGIRTAPLVLDQHAGSAFRAGHSPHT